MKNRLTALILLLIFMVLCSVVVTLSIYTYKLNGVIDKQNITLNNYKNIDSLMVSGNQDLVKSLVKFFDGTNTMVNGEHVSALDFLKYHNQVLDSLDLYKDYYRFSQAHYGVKLKKISINDSTSSIVSDPPTLADTASMLVPYYKHLVYKKDGKWYTNVTDYKGLLVESNKTLDDETNKRLNDTKKAVKSLEIAVKAIENYEKENGELIESNKQLRAILNKLKDRGIVKIDTSKGKIIYEY